ncbi:50S ribosomal protein L11 methyltransferase [Coralliovum pocilloporae]|uniref:50S ribosomal protein L11 methyltransferase n=1 Tax=Coralliovum pocilloporae TaxID=3066369 RepID=UPI003307042F
MPVLQASVTADKAFADRATDALEDLFSEDGTPIACFEVEDGVWCASVYLETEAPDTESSRIRTHLEAHGLAAGLVIEELPDTDWVTESLAGLTPVPVGRFLVHGSHDKDAVQPHMISLLVDAAQAFGTGHHGTTSGCLQAIDDLLKKRSFHRCIDVGTGTGVLAMALAKRLHRPVLASDIDPIATRVARDNARLNQCHPWTSCMTATGTHHPDVQKSAPYDLVVANILAGPLSALAPDLTRILTQDGRLILSGLLERQGNWILTRYRQHGLYLERRYVREGWLTLILKR